MGVTSRLTDVPQEVDVIIAGGMYKTTRGM